LPAGNRGSIFLLYQAPGFILDCFKRPQIDIHLHLVLALEILWHSPRVPACAASAILEFTRGKNAAGLIDNFHFRCRDSLIIAHYDIAVMLSGLTDNIKIYQHSRTGIASFGLNLKRRAFRMIWQDDTELSRVKT